MGHIRHHTIVVSCIFTQNLEAALAKARELFGDLVSAPVDGKVNSYTSFFIAPDGSKEGWPESSECDQAREKFVAWLNSERYGDGSSPFDWVEVEFPGDDSAAIVHSDTSVNLGSLTS